jgi:hypothetical protein
LSATRSRPPVATPWYLDQQQIGGGAAEIVLSFHLDVFGVFPLVAVGIKRLGLACRRQVLGELPGLEDRLDLGNEGISNRPKVKVQTAKIIGVAETP